MAEMKKKRFWRWAVLFSRLMTGLFLFRAKRRSALIFKKELKEGNPRRGKKVFLREILRMLSMRMVSEDIWFQLGSPCLYIVTI